MSVYKLMLSPFWEQLTSVWSLGLDVPSHLVMVFRNESSGSCIISVMWRFTMKLLSQIC